MPRRVLAVPPRLASTSTQASRSASSGATAQGKSTLLSLIAGVLIPDEGVVTVRAGVAPLIQITGGFEGELTARENV